MQHKLRLSKDEPLLAMLTWLKAMLTCSYRLSEQENQLQTSIHWEKHYLNAVWAHAEVHPFLSSIFGTAPVLLYSLLQCILGLVILTVLVLYIDFWYFIAGQYICNMGWMWALSLTFWSITDAMCWSWPTCDKLLFQNWQELIMEVDPAEGISQWRFQQRDLVLMPL